MSLSNFYQRAIGAAATCYPPVRIVRCSLDDWYDADMKGDHLRIWTSSDPETELTVIPDPDVPRGCWQPLVPATGVRRL